MTLDRRRLRPGDPAPDFTLAAADREGQVSLHEYRGRTGLFLALFRGLYCPFCRRQMVQLNRTAEWLSQKGVQTLAVVATLGRRGHDGRACAPVLPLPAPELPGRRGP